MCLVVLSLGYHPGHKLVAIVNRDEDLARPTLPLHFWEDEGLEHILGGAFFVG